MAALATDTPRAFDPAVPGHYDEYPVSASSRIYEGSFVSLNSGNARALNAADVFAGVADKPANNSSGSAGDIRVVCRTKGILKEISVATASAITNVNSAVYASDSGTLTLASTGNLQIGKVLRWHSGTKCDVYFEAAPIRSI